MDSFAADILFPPGNSTSYTYSVASDVYTLGHFQANTYDIDTGKFSVFTDIEANIAEVTVSVAAPEPATWLMIGLGLGGIGTLLRRRRDCSAFAQIGLPVGST